jgi:glycosyltransferase involved in cell wall biosynthesis
MAPRLKELFGDLAPVYAVNFGISSMWYEIERDATRFLPIWLCISRVTKKKLGYLLDWGESIFSLDDPLHLIGPNQEGLALPDWIVYHGAATSEDIANKWFPRTKGLISLSLHSEGRPQVMLEAMAAGIPIIASEIPAHISTIIDNESGYIVKSVEEFSESIKNLRDIKVQQEMSNCAKSTAIREFGTWNDCIKRYRKLYESLR